MDRRQADIWRQTNGRLTEVNDGHDDLDDSREEAEQDGDGGVTRHRRCRERGGHQGHDGSGAEGDVLCGAHEAVDKRRHERRVQPVLQAQRAREP